MIWLLLILLTIPTLADATTFYVGKSGNDANTCPTAQSATAGNRRLTVTAGIECLSAGDTLVVGDGTYTETIDDTLPSGSGSWETATVIKGETVCAPKAAPCGFILQPTSSSTNGIHLVNADTNWIKIQHVTIDMQNATGGEGEHCIKGTSSDGAVNGYPHHIWVDYFECKDGDGAGVQFLNEAVTSTSYGHIISNCSIHGNGTNANNQGIYWVSRDTTLQDCDVYSNTGPGMSIFESNTGVPSDNIVERNRIYSNGTAGASAGILFAWAVRPIVRNNLIYSNSGNGMEAISGVGGVQDGKLYNNTLYSNSGTCINLTETEYTGTAVRNNICRSNGTNSIVNSTGGTTGNNTTADPSFTNAAGGDFTLQSGSVARDAGATLVEVSNDFIGTARPQNSVFDIGAYEYIVSSGGGGQQQSPPWSSPRRNPLFMR